MEDNEILSNEITCDDQLLVDVSLHPTAHVEVDPLALDMIKQETVKQEVDSEDECYSSYEQKMTLALDIKCEESKWQVKTKICRITEKVVRPAYVYEEVDEEEGDQEEEEECECEQYSHIHFVTGLTIDPNPNWPNVSQNRGLILDAMYVELRSLSTFDQFNIDFGYVRHGNNNNEDMSALVITTQNLKTPIRFRDVCHVLHENWSNIVYYVHDK